ncbi:PEP-CTERM sorting domain-containing protein [Nostoc sp. NMS4]|uniref:PEP-CTERM sorting domain-containing protein n=1 Tax=Nostoc sp. NMS4 TaxID=2815390 RepID=UPI0025ECDDCB|nr:PEP-CTERM sorting domain-containing protein [Nostoc sp. NMS4]
MDSFEGSNTFAAFNLFDANGNSLASAQELAVLGTSDFPEGEIQLNFSGVAAYGTFNFSSDFGRYIIDNFEGNFGFTEVVTSVPEPATILGSGIALGVGALFHKRKRKRGGMALVVCPKSFER